RVCTVQKTPGAKGSLSGLFRQLKAVYGAPNPSSPVRLCSFHQSSRLLQSVQLFPLPSHSSMTSAWTNMSIAMIHRDIERDWEIQCGVMGVIFLLLEILAHSQKIYTSAKILERMRRSKFISIYLLLWSILEQMSNGAFGAWLTWRIALLVCFMVLVLLYFW
ncbi:hypothetical protein PanWU01x14_068170, partial [Parasponia andersonii]